MICPIIPIGNGSPILSTSALHIGQGNFRPEFLSLYCCHARSDTTCPQGSGARSRTGSSSVPIGQNKLSSGERRRVRILSNERFAGGGRRLPYIYQHNMLLLIPEKPMWSRVPNLELCFSDQSRNNPHPRLSSSRFSTGLQLSLSSRVAMYLPPKDRLLCRQALVRFLALSSSQPRLRRLYIVNTNMVLRHI